MQMNKKLIRGTVNLFGCIGLIIGIVGMITDNYTVVLASIVEMSICLTIRTYCRERKREGDD